MFLNARIQWILFIVQICLANVNCTIAPPSKDLKNVEKFNLNGWKPIHTLRVSTIQHEPFMYQIENGKFHNGIEYKLIQATVEKEHLNLSIQFHNQFKLSHFNELLYK